jgi:hypothetical protein
VNGLQALYPFSKMFRLLLILGRGNFLMRLDDTKDMVVQALVAQIRVDGIIGLDCLTAYKRFILFKKCFVCFY